MSKCKVGASLENGEEEAGNEEETLELGGDNKPVNTYKVYGTLKKPEESKKPDFLKEVVKVSQKILSLLLFLELVTNCRRYSKLFKLSLK